MITNNPPLVGCAIVMGQLTCDFPSLAPGTTNDITISLQATPITCDALTNQASVSAANEAAAQQNNNTSSVVRIGSCSE
jgi:hypothetical protein